MTALAERGGDDLRLAAKADDPLVQETRQNGLVSSARGR